VAIVGRPNVGKSSLLNALVGVKLAIVTPKPQTTRTRITGILTQDETQIVFIDTPGLHTPRTKLSEYMVREVNDSVLDVDIAILVTDLRPAPDPLEERLMDSFKRQNLRGILAINKIDLLDRKEELLAKIAAYNACYDFEAIVPISAVTGEGLDILLAEIKARAEEGPHHFADDSLTDQPERVLAAEMLREKLLLYMREEIPHGVAVVVETMKERQKGDMLDIEAYIYCEKDSHKGIIIGKNGAMLKKVASAARVDMEAFFACRVNLQVWVKVKENWRDRDGLLKNFGYKQLG
jgi:GTP-binding protein Era